MPDFRKPPPSSPRQELARCRGEEGGEPLPHLLIDFRAEREPLSLRLSVPSERYEDQDPAARPTRQGQVSSMELSAAFSFAVTESP